MVWRAEAWVFFGTFNLPLHDPPSYVTLLAKHTDRCRQCLNCNILLNQASAFSYWTYSRLAIAWRSPQYFQHVPRKEKLLI